MFGITRPLPSYLQGGFGDTNWIEDILRPIADTVKSYFDAQITQPTTTQKASIGIGGISPIYLIAGGLVVWWLFKGGKKGVVRRRKRQRR